MKPEDLMTWVFSVVVCLWILHFPLEYILEWRRRSK